MNAINQIKTAIIDYLSECEIDESLSVVDGKQIASFDPPLVAVDVTSSEAHSSALSMVHRAEVQIVLRCHPGDDTDSLAGWTDQIESALYDNSALSVMFSDAGMIVYEWIYAGTTQEWDESMHETRFAASILIQRTA